MIEAMVQYNGMGNEANNVPLLSVMPGHVAGFHFRDSIGMHCFGFDSLLSL
jgi:hypothetical protein